MTHPPEGHPDHCALCRIRWQRKQGTESEEYVPRTAKAAAVLAMPVDTSGPLYTLEEVEEWRRYKREGGNVDISDPAWREATSAALGYDIGAEIDGPRYTLDEVKKGDA